MKKSPLIIITAVLALSILFTVGVCASADYAAQQKTEIVPEKIYFAYYSEPCRKGAVGFCLDNRFVSFGECEESISICSVDEQGNRTVLHDIPKEKAAVWFAGETKYKLQAGDTVKSLFGGLSAVGICIDSEKTNLVLKLDSQPLERDTEYYIYIPENYFVDSDGNQSGGGYIQLKPEAVKSCTGNPLVDLRNLALDAVDFAGEFWSETFASCRIYGETNDV